MKTTRYNDRRERAPTLAGRSAPIPAARTIPYPGGTHQQHRAREESDIAQVRERQGGERVEQRRNRDERIAREPDAHAREEKCAGDRARADGA